MVGTKKGAKLARQTNLEKYGTDFYQKIGAKGGSTKKTKPSGFATLSRERHRELSVQGGKAGKRGKFTAEEYRERARRYAEKAARMEQQS